MTTTGPRKTTAATRRPRQVSTVTPIAKVEIAPVETVSEPKKILIHFVSDGLTAFGYVWSKGQELELTVGSPEYMGTFDIGGNSWLNMTEDEQVARWGSVKFKSGESTIPNSLINYLVLPADKVNTQGIDIYKGSYLSRTEREKVAQAEKARGRSIPKIF